jgi:hypothetical protein
MALTRVCRKDLRLNSTKRAGDISGKGLETRIRRTDPASPRRAARHAAGRRHLHHQAAEGRAAGSAWQTAVEALILVATIGGPTMLARIGIMRALNRGHDRGL